MDTVDEQIIERLKDDGRAAYTAIAEEVGVSEGTVRNRVEQLQENGIIERFTIDVADTDAISVFVMVDVDPAEDIDTVLAQFPDDITLHEITGEWDIISQFSRPTSEAVNDTLETIRKTGGVIDTQTYTVLESRDR